MSNNFTAIHHHSLKYSPERSRVHCAFPKAEKCSLLLSLRSQEQVAVKGWSGCNCYFSILWLLAIAPLPSASPSCCPTFCWRCSPPCNGYKHWQYTPLASCGALCWRIQKGCRGNWCIAGSINTTLEMRAQHLLHLVLGQTTQQQFPFHLTFPVVANRKGTMKVSLQYCPLEINFTIAKCSFTQIWLNTYCLCYIFHPY